MLTSLISGYLFLYFIALVPLVVDCAPALNSDLTPSVTETTGLSSSEIEPKPPITRVRDGDLNRERTPLKNVTNTALTSDNTDTDGDSEKKRKKVGLYWLH